MLLYSHCTCTYPAVSFHILSLFFLLLLQSSPPHSTFIMVPPAGAVFSFTFQLSCSKVLKNESEQNGRYDWEKVIYMGTFSLH